MNKAPLSTMEARRAASRLAEKKIEEKTVTDLDKIISAERAAAESRRKKDIEEAVKKAVTDERSAVKAKRDAKVADARRKAEEARKEALRVAEIERIAAIERDAVKARADAAKERKRAQTAIKVGGGLGAVSSIAISFVVTAIFPPAAIAMGIVGGVASLGILLTTAILADDNTDDKEKKRD